MLARAGKRCDGDLMRWEQLFDDIEARFEAMAEADELADVADRRRVEQGAVTMSARLAGALGATVRLGTSIGIVVSGVLASIGPDWALLREGPDRDVLIRLDAVTVVEGLTLSTGRPLTGVALRLDLRRSLRAIARDRSPVAIGVPGEAAGGTSSELTGTIDRIGADFIEMALHAPWEPRRAAAVRAVVLVPLAAVVIVRPAAMG